MMDYKLLEALVSVIEEQGFDRAAAKLCITQSAVSQRIKALEEQAGRILVTRTTPPSATREGKRLVKHYRQVKALEADLFDPFGKRFEAGITTLAVGINADSLATWFMPAAEPFLKRSGAVLDLKVDDQEQTLKMLRNGDVIGCVSSQEKAVQGCRSVYLGTMAYCLAATPEFVDTYAIQDLDEDAFVKAPTVIFNRKDDLHELFFQKFFNKKMPALPVHYIPSSESFADAIIRGLACGMIPALQGREYTQQGLLIDLAPEFHIPVDLFWHCWNIQSKLLNDFSASIVKNAVIW